MELLWQNPGSCTAHTLRAQLQLRLSGAEPLYNIPIFLFFIFQTRYIKLQNSTHAAYMSFFILIPYFTPACFPWHSLAASHPLNTVFILQTP